MNLNFQWTERKDKILAAIIQDGGNSRDAKEVLGCSIGTVADRAYKLGLKLPRSKKDKVAT